MIARVGVVDTRGDTPSLRDETFRKSNSRGTAPCNRHSCRGKPVDTGRVRANHERSLPSRRRGQTVEIRRKKSELGFVRIPFQVSLKLPGRKSFQHFITFKNKNSSGEKGCSGRVVNVAAHIITVWPHANLWIINEVCGVGDEIVKVVRSGGVLCLRDGYALM